MLRIATGISNLYTSYPSDLYIPYPGVPLSPPNYTYGIEDMVCLVGLPPIDAIRSIEGAWGTLASIGGIWIERI